MSVSKCIRRVRSRSKVEDRRALARYFREYSLASTFQPFAGLDRRVRIVSLAGAMRREHERKWTRRRRRDGESGFVSEQPVQAEVSKKLCPICRSCRSHRNVPPSLASLWVARSDKHDEGSDPFGGFQSKLDTRTTIDSRTDISRERERKRRHHLDSALSTRSTRETGCHDCQISFGACSSHILERSDNTRRLRRYLRSKGNLGAAAARLPLRVNEGRKEGKSRF